MNRTLLPFTPTPHPLNMKVEVLFSQLELSISYKIYGALQEVSALQTECLLRERASELWKNTCFEWFLKARTGNDSVYWEFNASPAGQWNFYELSHYRSPLRLCPHLTSVNLLSNYQIHQNSKQTEYIYSVRTSLKELFNNNPSLNEGLCLGVSTVILWTQTQHYSYFALKHPEAKADFHDPCGFDLHFTKEVL